MVHSGRIRIHNKKLGQTEKELCCRCRLCTDPKDERLDRQAIYTGARYA